MISFSNFNKKLNLLIMCTIYMEAEDEMKLDIRNI